MESSHKTQVGGTHYDMPIQPIEYIHKNCMGFIEGCIVKYVSRHHAKGRDEDIKKVIDYAVKLLKLEYDYTDDDVASFLSVYKLD